MKKPIVVRATGLGHPEGPYELDDGRVTDQMEQRNKGHDAILEPRRRRTGSDG